MPPPPHFGPNSSIFMQFLAKILPNDRLTPPLWLVHPSGKSWIRHWLGYFIYKIEPLGAHPSGNDGTTMSQVSTTTSLSSKTTITTTDPLTTTTTTPNGGDTTTSSDDNSDNNEEQNNTEDSHLSSGAIVGRCTFSWRFGFSFNTQSLQYWYFYRPQTKFAKVIDFTGVCLSRGGEYLGRYTPRQVSPAGTPPGQVPPRVGTLPPRAGTLPAHSACWDTVNKRVLRIPLECILVLYYLNL